MGRYLDRLRARNFTDSYGKEVSKVSKAPHDIPFETFETTLPIENEKYSPSPEDTNISTHLENGTVKSVKSPRRMTLAEYGALLNEAVTKKDLPPVPPYRLGDPEHAAAWDGWWDTVELQRAHRRAAP